MLQQVVPALLAAASLVLCQLSQVTLDVTDWLTLCPDEPVYGITLRVGERQALVNGMPVELQGAPFVEGDVFYYPLEDMVRLHGNAYQQNGGQAWIDAGDEGRYCLEAGSTLVTAADGTTCTNPLRQQYFLQPQPRYRRETIRPPVLQEGVLYVPCGFRLTDRGGPEYLNAYTQYPDSGFVIFSGTE